MPLWLYQISPLAAALCITAIVEFLSLIGLLLTRRFLLPRLRFSEGVNDAVSGTVQSIGVFYGITVGLIAVGVWSTNSESKDIVSKEAAAIGILYRDISSYPSPKRENLQNILRQYTHFTIEQGWPSQAQGHILYEGAEIVDQFQHELVTFDPKTPGEVALHSEALGAYNNFVNYRNLRIDAIESGLSTEMWWVIWVGAAISIAVAYLYKMEDGKLHFFLISLMAGFLSLVLFMIVVNDKPFYGAVRISPEPYKLILDRIIERKQ